MNDPPLWLVIDCESIGLHGETFAVGWLLIDRTGDEHASGVIACHPDAATGDAEGRDWVCQNVPRLLYGRRDPLAVRDAFWHVWTDVRARGAVLAADCPWPVESRFLASCVTDDLPARCWSGPYPVVDVASVRLAAGLDPLGTEPRLPTELPAHDPLADARQSGRLLIEALDRIRGWAGPGPR